MATFRTGKEAINKAAESRGSSKFTPTIQFKEGDTKFLQFLTAIEDIPTVLMHNFIIVGTNPETNKPIYETFISRTDPALDGAGGYDPLITRFKEMPKNRCIALAVELEAKFKTVKGREKVDGFTVVERQFENKEGEVVTVPSVGLVIQSPNIFFGALTTMDEDYPISDTVMRVTRRGKGKDTQYVFSPAGDVLDLTEELKGFDFDFEAYLDGLADEDKIRDAIEPLADDWVVNPWSKRKATKSSRSNAVAQDTDEPAEAAEVVDEDVEGEDVDKDKSTARKSRFAALRDETG